MALNLKLLKEKLDLDLEWEKKILNNLDNDVVVHSYTCGKIDVLEEYSERIRIWLDLWVANEENKEKS